MTTGIDFTKQIGHTETLLKELAPFKKREERLDYLKNHPVAVHFVAAHKRFKSLIIKLKPELQEIIFTLLAMGQGTAVFSEWDKFEDPLSQIKEVALSLKPLQKSYKTIGGLVGYQLVFLKLLQRQKSPPAQRQISCPKGLSIEKSTPEVRAYTRAGIEEMPLFGEVYPVGGAGDRLNLLHDKTGEPLPQARLCFDGVTLLEGLIHDLIGREKLYEALTGKKIITPVALMTSSEKNNHQHITTILEENNWFGRPKNSFFLFEQPLVPMVSDEGYFATKGPLELNLKPGGHGIIWELMKTDGVFKWFHDHGRSQLLIRQINNPLADTDRNLLTLAGKGTKDRKAFGFLSCSRLVGAPEGMNVIQQSRNEDGFFNSITNIEYTDFAERGLKDEPEFPDSRFSAYPANTNILFGNMTAIKKALLRLPLPGLLINMKGQVDFYERGGERVHSKGGRVETTMQNIADVIENFSPAAPVPEEALKTFILFNTREKTLSVTKQNWKEGLPFEGTPQGAWLDRQRNYKDLFTNYLNFKLPEWEKECTAPYHIRFHPALGPLWEVIAQKITRGTLAKNAELKLDIIHLCLQDLDLGGTLVINSCTLEGTALLKNVKIRNRGVDKKFKNHWTGDIKRHEKVEIILHGKSEFIAEGVELIGPHHFEVPDKHRMRIFFDKGKIKSSLEKMTAPSWRWGYQFAEDDSVLLTFNSRTDKLLA